MIAEIIETATFLRNCHPSNLKLSFVDEFLHVGGNCSSRHPKRDAALNLFKWLLGLSSHCLSKRWHHTAHACLHSRNQLPKRTLFFFVVPRIKLHSFCRDREQYERCRRAEHWIGSLLSLDYDDVIGTFATQKVKTELFLTCKCNLSYLQSSSSFLYRLFHDYGRWSAVQLHIDFIYSDCNSFMLLWMLFCLMWYIHNTCPLKGRQELKSGPWCRGTWRYGKQTGG
jgi:hypothetical protein